MLLDSLLHQLPDTAIVLTARSTNPAIALHQRHGYVIVDNITNRVGTTSVKMVRNLTTEPRRADIAPAFPQAISTTSAMRTLIIDPGRSRLGHEPSTT